MVSLTWPLQLLNLFMVSLTCPFTSIVPLQLLQLTWYGLFNLSIYKHCNLYNYYSLHELLVCLQTVITFNLCTIPQLNSQYNMAPVSLT